MNNHHRPHGVPAQPNAQEQFMAATLDAFITADNAALPPAIPTDLAPDDRAAFAMAARLRRQLLRAAATPSADFVADLGERLAAMVAETSQQPYPDKAPSQLATDTNIAPLDGPDTSVTNPRPTKRTPSRRAMLAGGLSAAAGLAAGVAGGILVDHTTPATPPTSSGPWGIALVGGTGVWQTVATVAEIAPGGVKRFATTNLVGHLIRRNDGSFYALSAACTHMGCIVAWNVGQHTFDCPCHNGRFDGQGTALPNQPFPYRPLPPIATKITADVVYVWVPAPTTSPAASATPDNVPTSSAPYDGT